MSTRRRSGHGPLTGLRSTGAGVLGAGVCTYAFLTLAGRALGPVDFAPVSALWALVFVVGPGLFLPLQQEMGRLLAPQRADRGGARARTLVALVGAALALAVGGATLLVAEPLVDVVFDGRTALLWCFLAAILTHAVSFLARGALTGLGDFSGYGALVFGEAAIRLLLALAATVAGQRTPTAYGVAIAAAPLLAAALVTRLGRRTRLTPGHHVAVDRVVVAMAWLISGSLLAQLVANAGPVLVQAASPQGSEAAGIFLSALVVARLPLYLFQAVQATMLPNFSALVSHGRHDEFRAGVRRLVQVCLLLVVVATAGAAVLGSWAVALLFGEGFDVTRRTITLLTAASCVYLLAMALVNVGVAAGRHHLATWCWTAGSVTFALTLLLADDLLLRVELAYALGSLAAATLALLRVVGLRGQVRVSGARSGRPPAPAS
jgi:O-antigen/teichoic acid export membrane protein